MQHQISKSTRTDYEVVYNLTELLPDLYLPEAFIVSRDRDGYLAHIQQKALPETIGSFDLELDPLRRQLFELIETLQPKALEKRFNTSKKRPKSLEVLLEDRAIKQSVLKYVHRQLDILLVQVLRRYLPLTLEVERKVLVKDFLVTPQQEELEPLLAFERTASAIQYRLRLGHKGRAFRISEYEVLPVTNHPVAWIILDYKLFKVAHINGHMVKPFRQKDEVTIPRASVKTYFEKFITKVVSKVDIEAKGFEVICYDKLSGALLEPVKDLFNDRWVLALRMIYPNAEFNWSDKKDRRTTLDFNTDDIRILQVRRDEETEKSYIDKLSDFGLEQAEGSYFFPGEASDHPNFLLEWMSRHRPELEKAGFEVAQPEYEEKKLYLYPADIQLGASQKNDWFDIYGNVNVGDFSFPFLRLASYIRDDNPYYPLPNGTYFVIPQEWMSRYRSLVQFGRKDGDELRLSKSQYPLLQELGLQEGQEVEEKLDADDYSPSQKLKAELRPYQLEGVRWLVKLYRSELGGCLADDMGLGKTLQTIAVLLYAKEQRAAKMESDPAGKPQLSLFDTVPDADVLKPLNALIILPASLVYNWESEIRQFAPSLSTYKHIGPKRHKDSRILARYDVVLTTYQTALRDVELLRKIEHEYIVLDESHYIKNRESKIFKAINNLEARHKVSLSGTPIENSLSDLWSQMQFINPNLLGNFSFFRREFINPIEKHQQEDKKDRLRKLVDPYLLRRTKEEVVRDLPPLTNQVFYSEMTGEQRRLYEKEKSAARNFLLENYDGNDPQYKMMVLRSLTKLRQLANHPKLTVEEYEKGSGKFQDVLEHWDTIRRSGHKVLFFSFFVQYLELFRAEFESAGLPYTMLTGDLSAAQRQKQIERFEKEQEVQSFLISIKSGGTGLNLTAAEYVFILDPWWNPFTEQQAIARAHRIGQEKRVMAVKFITKDSIEEKILRLQEKKSKLAEDIIGSAGKASFSRGELEYLFE